MASIRSALYSLLLLAASSSATDLSSAQAFAAAEQAASAPDAGRQGGADLSSLLQKPSLGTSPEAVADSAEVASEPFLVGLRRESVPVYRRGKVASFKTSYSGVLHVGSPPQEFRVVFDTGSGHLVLPAEECKSEACLVEGRRRFNMSGSSTAAPINADGSIVPEGDPAEQVTIGFGTGEITGEFTRDTVCFGAPHSDDVAALAAPQDDSTAVVPAGDAASSKDTELCVEMSVILAVEMSTQPFKTFRFDGILGLGLDGLALNKNFSAFEMLLGTGLPSAHFGVFLTEGEDGEESEIAMGGIDSKRILEPLSWAPVAMPEMGYWQVQIVAVRINGQELDVCKDGTCRGVVDTGTSHLGVPAPADSEVAQLLTTDAGDMLDCRLADAPEIEIELVGYNLTLHPFNYMRRLPLREGVSVSSAQGVYVPSNETNATLGSPSSADPVGQAAQAQAPAVPAAPADGQAIGQVQQETAAAAEPQAPASEQPAAEVAAAQAQAPAPVAEVEEAPKRFCRPRLMPVRLPEPLGPKLFILGEPVLHRYYTVYDWANNRVGFSLANNRRNTMDPSEIVDRRGALPKEVDVLLMQKTVTVTKDGKANRIGSGRGGAKELQEESMLVQVKLRLSVRQRRRA